MNSLQKIGSLTRGGTFWKFDEDTVFLDSLGDGPEVIITGIAFLKNGKEKKMKAPIFIVGTPRSGTTLTARILGRHSRLFMPGEVHFFEDVYSRRKELGSPENADCRTKIVQRLSTLYGRFNEPEDQRKIEKLFNDPTIRREMESPCNSYGEILSTFMEIQARSEGKSRWGNNAPRDLFSVEDIVSFYPDAKIILCIRDVRDFLVSYRDKWKATSVENSLRLRALYHPVVTALLWKSSARKIAALEENDSGSQLLLRYEELVGRPEQTVRKICEFIGEDFEPDMLDIQSSNSSADSRGKGIFASSVGRWRGSLDEVDVQAAQLLTRKELVRLGYPLERVRASRIQVAGKFLSAPYAFWRALAANREKRGPLISYAVRRAAPFLRRKSNSKGSVTISSRVACPDFGKTKKAREAQTPLSPAYSKQMKLYVSIIAVSMVLFYGTYALFDPGTVISLGMEDGPFEDMTALFFFIAFIVFAASFFKYRSWFFILLSLIFLFGFGEEISWGQRLIGFDTPSIIEESNVLGEFNLHNIEVFNSENFNNSRKHGLEKLLTINFQYKLFWLTYGVLLPFAALKIPRMASLLRKYRIAVPPLSIGIFFLVNWLAFRILLTFILPPGETDKFYDTAGEIMECISALLFMLTSFCLYRGNVEQSGMRSETVCPAEPPRRRMSRGRLSFFQPDAKTCCPGLLKPIPRVEIVLVSSSPDVLR